MVSHVGAVKLTTYDYTLCKWTIMFISPCFLHRKLFFDAYHATYSLATFSVFTYTATLQQLIYETFH